MKRTELWRTPLDLISRYRSALMGAAALFILLYHCWIRVNLQVWKLAELERNILSVGFIGVGGRGAPAVHRIAQIPGCEVAAISDVNAERLDAVRAEDQESLNIFLFDELEQEIR